MEEYLIKNTTREQREQIVKDSLGYSELGCDDAMDGYDMYLPYIEGIKELREITMEYQAQYVRDMERDSLAVILPAAKNGNLEALENVLDKLDVDANTDSLETKWVVAKREEGEEELHLRDLAIREGLVPNVIGMGAKDAVLLLESAGLRVVLDGMGRVSAQSMGAGTRIAKGQSIRLTLR